MTTEICTRQPYRWVSRRLERRPAVAPGVTGTRLTASDPAGSVPRVPGDESLEANGVLDRARDGDEHAWSVLYDSVAAQLLGYLRVRGADDPDALLGDVFLHVARGIDDFEGTASGFRSWVFVIATSRLLDERRRRRRKPTETLDLTVEDRLSCADDVEEEVEHVHAIEASVELLSVLTPDQRAVVELRVFGELTSREVADIVDKPVGAVKALYRRGLATLRRELEGDDEGPGRSLLVAIGAGGVSPEAYPAVTEGS